MEIDKFAEGVKAESRKLRNEVKRQTVGYILAALGLVAGLAWNQAITAFIDKFFGGTGSLGAKFIYAIVITLVVVTIGIYLARLAEAENKK